MSVRGATTRLGAASGVLACTLMVPAAADEPCRNPDYKHGISYVLPLKYGPDFEHFDYANPDAPKGGPLRLPDMGTFDSFNNILEKGRVAAGVDFGGSRNLVFETLLESAADEPASAYGRLAQGVHVEDDFTWVAFKLRDNARWHDGEPVTVADIVFSFEAFKEHGSVALKTGLTDLDRVEIIGEHEVCFVTRPGAEINPIMPFAYGNMPIQARHYWAERDISRTTTEPALGAGPYRLKEVDFGRRLIYERVPDYWGAEIPVNRGRYNFDTVKFDYFRDENIMLEAHKGNVFDLREETVSKNWTTQYVFPAVEAGVFKADLRYISRVWGLWWPVFWNMERERFHDIRVREALWLLYDFPYINRVILYGFYDTGVSFFHNSPMAQHGLPSDDELALLEPFRDELPERLFTEVYQQPASTGYGFPRERVDRALSLFREAGWILDDGRLVHHQTGERFRVDFVFVSAMLLRAEMPYIERLNRVGIETTARSPEVSHWQHRMRTGSFDGGAYLYIPDNTPGLALRNRFGSAAADQPYSQNWARIRDPVLDYLIDKAIGARSARELYAATRAIDRVLLWKFYFIPGMAQPGYRLVHWDKFGEVKDAGPLSRVPAIDAWWWDEDKANTVATWLATAEK